MRNSTNLVQLGKLQKETVTLAGAERATVYDVQPHSETRGGGAQKRHSDIPRDLLRPLLLPAPLP
eukprot:5439149-Amphidinium_carterae.1